MAPTNKKKTKRVQAKKTFLFLISGSFQTLPMDAETMAEVRVCQRLTEKPDCPDIRVQSSCEPSDESNNT